MTMRVFRKVLGEVLGRRDSHSNKDAQPDAYFAFAISAKSPCSIPVLERLLAATTFAATFQCDRAVVAAQFH